MNDSSKDIRLSTFRMNLAPSSSLHKLVRGPCPHGCRRRFFKLSFRSFPLCAQQSEFFGLLLIYSPIHGPCLVGDVVITVSPPRHMPATPVHKSLAPSVVSPGLCEETRAHAVLEAGRDHFVGTLPRPMLADIAASTNEESCRGWRHRTAIEIGTCSRHSLGARSRHPLEASVRVAFLACTRGTYSGHNLGRTLGRLLGARTWDMPRGMHSWHALVACFASTLSSDETARISNMCATGASTLRRGSLGVLRPTSTVCRT